MRNTYYLNLGSADIIPTTETILPIVNTPYIEQAAVLGIMNNYGSDAIVRIREIQFNEIVGRTTTVLTALDLWRVTAITGGKDIDSTPYDSTAAALPSEVSIVKYPNTVITTGSYLRRMQATYGLNPTGAFMWHYGMNGGSQSGGMNLARMFGGNDSDVQKIILNEGEGIALRTNFASPQNYSLELTIHFSDGVNTYCVDDDINMQSTTELFSIFNGSGSGVVITILRIEMRLIRTADIPFFTVESFSGMHGGMSVAPIPMDSRNPTVNSLVDFRQNSVVTQGNIDAAQGRNARTGGDLIPWRRMIQPVFGKGINLASGALQLRPINNEIINVDKANNTGEIVLQQGEGIGIFQRANYSGMGNFEFVILFTVQNSGGNEHSYVF